jgi:hypothetical protein
MRDMRSWRFRQISHVSNLDLPAALRTEEIWNRTKRSRLQIIGCEWDIYVRKRYEAGIRYQLATL